MLVLLNGCIPRTLIKCLKKTLDKSYTRMLRAILKNPRSSIQQNSRYLAISFLCYKTSNKHQQDIPGTAEKNKDWLLSNWLLCTSMHWYTSVGRPAKTYINQFYANTGCHLEELPIMLANQDWWRDRVEGIHAVNMPWGGEGWLLQKKKKRISFDEA